MLFQVTFLVCGARSMSSVVLAAFNNKQLIQQYVTGTGAMVAAVTTAAGRQPVVLGKPSKFMFEIVQRRHPSIQPARTLMIGDRLEF